MVLINEWPASQICVGCIHAIPILEGFSKYGCEKDCIAYSECCNKNRKEATEEEWKAKFK